MLVAIRKLCDAMAPTVELHFADSRHLFEIVSDEVDCPVGARRMATLYAHFRKAELPEIVTSCRQYLFSLREMGAEERPAAIAKAVRLRVADATNVLFKVRIPWLPLKGDFERAYGRAEKAFLADPDGPVT